MNARSGRGSTRVRNLNASIPSCETCGGRLERAYEILELEQERCLACHHICLQDLIEYCLSVRSWNSLAASLCLCPCDCANASDPSDDEDFEVDDMDLDDDLDTQLDERTERTLAARFGLHTNVVLNRDSVEERRLFFERAGHYAVSSSHDIGRPAESSLANTENTIPRTELTRLRDEIQPWEADAMHLSTGRPYNVLQRTFPEIQNPDRRPTHAATRRLGSNDLCPGCDKPYTYGFSDWLENGTVTMCGICHSARRPGIPEEDPDHDLNASTITDYAGYLAYCHCRCACGFLQAPGDLRITEGELRRPVQPTPADAVPRPRIAHIANWTVPRHVPGVLADAYREVYEAELRDRFGLPDLHLSRARGSAEAVAEDIEVALRTTRSAIFNEQWELAYRHLQAVGQMGRYTAELADSDDLMLQIFQLLRRVHRHLIPRTDTSDDTLILDDIDAILHYHEISDSEPELEPIDDVRPRQMR